MVRVLSREALRERARRVLLVASDVDGVLTDAGVWYSPRGEELLRFSRRDGLGIELLRRSGIDVAWITRERSAIVAARAAKLEIVHLYAGVRDKRACLGELCSAAGVTVDEVAFMGDDVNDLELIERVAGAGLCAAPADAHPSVAARVHFVSGARGGQGAFRELADLILTLRQEED